jgi:hypothetical protein
MAVVEVEEEEVLETAPKRGSAKGASVGPDDARGESFPFASTTVPSALLAASLSDASAAEREPTCCS